MISKVVLARNHVPTLGAGKKVQSGMLMQSEPADGERTVSKTETQVSILGDWEHFTHSILRKAFDQVGIDYAENATDSACFLFWNPWSRLDPAAFRALTGGRPLINGSGFNCAKTLVQQRFFEVAGYPLAVDPCTFSGPMVRKSETNALHDGLVLQGPLDIKDCSPGFVYERLVDNRFGPSVLSVRVTITRTVSECCYLKTSKLEDRFDNLTGSWLAPTEILFDRSEVQLIESFCQAMLLDFGQVDVVRDNASGRIYVVDANNTPYGPSDTMSESHVERALSTLAGDFVGAFLSFSED